MTKTLPDIVLVRFPFTDLEKAKQRPALVISRVSYSSRLELITIAMLTSNLENTRIQGDFELQEWKQSGLLHPTLLRLSKLATIEGSLVIKKLGTLSSQDFKSVQKLFSDHFQTWIAR